MKRTQGQSTPIIPPEKYSHAYTDIDYAAGDWVPGIVETARSLSMISPERTEFEPNRHITRAEAYAMIMSSVCLTVPESQKPTYTTWQEGIYDIARIYGLTSRTWQGFEPQKSILRQELFVLVSRAADWAERS